MSSLDYEFCLVCEKRAMYVGHADSLRDQELGIVHIACLDRMKAQIAGLTTQVRRMDDALSAGVDLDGNPLGSH